MAHEAAGDANPDALPELESHVSENLVCPITNRIMDLPVVSPSGHTYDRDSIVTWLARRSVDPLSLEPLSPACLYPNRALQDEIIAQLELVAARAAAAGDKPLLEAARAKLGSVRAARCDPGKPRELAVVTPLDRLAGRCACWAAWWEVLAREHLLMFATSFGVLACVGVDLHASGWGGCWPSREPRSMLLSSFLRLVLSPGTPVPGHWSLWGRLPVLALRCATLACVGPMLLTLVLGGMLSLLRFGQRCTEVRAVELARVERSRWFAQLLQGSAAVTGFSSLVLFARLYRDHLAAAAAAAARAG